MFVHIVTKGIDCIPLGLPQWVASDSPCGRLHLPRLPSGQDLVPVPGMHHLKNQAPYFASHSFILTDVKYTGECVTKKPEALADEGSCLMQIGLRRM